MDRPILTEAVSDAGCVLVSDYGAGMSADPVVRHGLADCAAVMPVVWGPRPHGPSPDWDDALSALDRSAGVELREIVVAADTEPSWP